MIRRLAMAVCAALCTGAAMALAAVAYRRVHHSEEPALS
jgi:hypothetical protein